jgi:L-aspartate oxidase
MGGIVADLHSQSTLPGLYAVGESSCTGLHGANRLASNSLSECFVFARRAVAHALAQPAPPRRAAGEAELARLRELPAPPLADADTRDALWREAGIVRSADGLSRLLDSRHPLVRAIARCALARDESRGAHQRSDHPERKPALDGRHVIVRGGGDGDGAQLGDERIAWHAWS